METETGHSCRHWAQQSCGYDVYDVLYLAPDFAELALQHNITVYNSLMLNIMFILVPLLTMCRLLLCVFCVICQFIHS